MGNAMHDQHFSISIGSHRLRCGDRTEMEIYFCFCEWAKDKTVYYYCTCRFLFGWHRFFFFFLFSDPSRSLSPCTDTLF